MNLFSQLNDICKYADDTTLLVPEHTNIAIDMEFNCTKSWALTNSPHLTLNLTKSKEMVFKRPRARCFHLPPAIDNIEQLVESPVVQSSFSVKF